MTTTPFRFTGRFLIFLCFLSVVLPAFAHVDTGGGADTGDHTRQVIGYITNWDAWKNTNAGVPAQGALTHLNIDFNKYTILNFSFFGVANDGSLHSGDHRNKNIYLASEVQEPADIFYTDIYSSWDLHILFGEIDPIQYISEETAQRCTAQGFEVQVGGNTWEQPTWGLSGTLPVPLHKEDGAPGLLEEAHEKGVNVMASIGGWSMCKHFPEMAADPDKRQRFINDCKTLINAGFDGIDLDWEYPGPFAGMNFTGSEADYDNFLTLVKELREVIGPDKLLTAAFSADSNKLQGFDWAQLDAYLDYFNFMTYDFNGGWSDTAGFNSNIYDYTGSESPSFNWQTLLETLEALNVPKNKINFGAPFYGRGVVCKGTADLNIQTTKRSEFVQPDGPITTAADYTNWPLDVYDGTPTYFFIKQTALVSGSGWTRHWHEDALVPYLTKDTYFLSYDDEESMGHKAQFILDEGLAGVIIWTVYGDLEFGGTVTSYGTKLKQWSDVQSPLVNRINEIFASSDGGGGDDDGDDNDDSDDGDDANDDGDNDDGDDTVDGCSGLSAWSASTIYVNGDQVGHDNRIYQAKWWTQGEEPGTTGQWGVWEDLGPCGESDEDDSDNTDGDDSGDDTEACTGLPSWTASTIYVKGDQVKHDNRKYQAKWWTQGKEPGTTGQWGVWEDLGPCGDSDEDDSDNTDDDNDGDDDNDDDDGDDGGAGDEFPDNVFAPYVDVLLYPTFSINDAYAQTGQKYYTLAFIISGSNCQPAWGGVTPLENGFYLDEINAIREKGGDVIISFGGAGGTELAVCEDNTSELQAAYQSVIDKYSLTWVDFDIEGAAVADSASIDRRNKAIKGLQDANPDLKVAFCLPVMPQGLTGDGLSVLENAMQNGVRVDVVNVMAMDYGSWGAPDPEGNMGAYAIEAAQSTYSQLENLGLEAEIGITPMIGQNDVAAERFYLDDADELTSWANSTDYVSLLSMWSATRDNGDCPGQLSATCSGISQEAFAFTDIFSLFTSD